MSYIAVQTEIDNLLKTIPNAPLYRGRVDDEAILAISATADKLKPFQVVNYGGFINPGQQVNGIVGAAYDSHLSTIVIRAVASSDKDSMSLWQRIWDKLIGYVPANCGEIQAALYGGVGEISSLGNPTRYAATQSFKLLINSDKIEP